MTVPFASIVVHKFVTTAGPYFGLGSIIAVAILILLFFAHARETATLRERLDEAHSRIGALEARIAQLMHAQAAAQRGRQPVPVQPAPAPAPVRPMGSAVASVRRVPAAGAAPAGVAIAGAGAATVAAPAATATARASGLAPAAPAGMAAPALASATKLIPDAEIPKAPATNQPDDTVFVSAAAVANGRPEAVVAPLTAATQALPAVAAPPALAPAVTAPRRPGTGNPPRVQIGADAAQAPVPPRRATSNPRPVTAAGSLLEPERPRRRLAGRVVPLVIGGLALVVIIVGLVVITNSGGDSTAGSATQNSAVTGQSLSQHHAKAPTFKPGSVTVAVLNATADNGLAGRVGAKLSKQGYREGNVTNAATQTQGSTFVYYVPGSANKIAAEHVAKSLKLSHASVQPATQTAIQSCSTTVSGSSVGSCDATVIVSVGADLAGASSNG